MKQILIFLGSGASVPFGLPSMKDMVQLFEQKLEKSKLTNKEIMMRLYGSIKRTLFNTYGYVDLESVFTVLLSISQRMKCSDLGFTALFAMKDVADPNLNIATEEDVTAAEKLLKNYKTFVKRACLLKDSKEKRITEVYSDFFQKLGSKHVGQRIKGKDGQQYTYPYDCSIYTTNYDAVLETYWRGIAYINDLWENTNGMSTLQVEKHDGDVLDLIKLHGSLDWFGLTDGTIVKLDKKHKTYGKRKVRQGEIMLYPIQQKDLYLYPWFNLFYRFKVDLEHTKTWIVIGYSFNDEYILNMFREALGIGDHRLILVTPHADEIVEEKFSQYSTDKVRKILTRFGEKQTTVDIVAELDRK